MCMQCVSMCEQWQWGYDFIKSSAFQMPVQFLDAENGPCVDAGHVDVGEEHPERPRHKARAGKGNAYVAVNRKWLRISAAEESFVLGSSTLKLAHKLGIQPRDLRFLEMQTASHSPPVLLARESCIVLCFESIRWALFTSGPRNAF